MTIADRPAGINGAAGPTGVPAGVLNGGRVSAPVDVVARLRAAISSRLAAAGALSDGERDRRIAMFIAQEIDANARADIGQGRAPLSPQVEAAVARALRDSFTGLGGLQRLIDDPGVEDVFAQGCDNVWVRTVNGEMYRAAPVAATDEDLIDMIQVAAARSGQEERRFDRGSPSLSLRLPGGQRLFAVMAVSKRPSLSIRRNSLHQVTLADLQGLGLMPGPIRELITAMVKAKKNVGFTGGTGAGKTTLLRGAAKEIGPVERIVTVEDAFELGLDEDPVAHPNAVALQQREPNLEGVGGIDMATMVKWGLRMRPDRVIVGEARGAEALQMLFAMSQGNDGSMCTVHASSSRQALLRLAMYTMAAPEKLTFEAANMLIGQAVDFVVHIATATDGTRVISSILEVLESTGDQVPANEIYRPGPDRRAIPGSPMRSSTLDDLAAAGFNPDLLHQDRW
jgi:pilus assembly protein CpaF